VIHNDTRSTKYKKKKPLLLLEEKLDYVGKEGYGTLWYNAWAYCCENTGSTKYMQPDLILWVQTTLDKSAPVGCYMRLSVLKTVIKWQHDWRMAERTWKDMAVACSWQHHGNCVKKWDRLALCHPLSLRRGALTANTWESAVQVKGKAIPLQALTGPEGSMRLRLPDFKTIETQRQQGCQPYRPAAFTPRKYSWYSFLLEAESTPGPECGRKDYVNEKFQWHHRESIPQPSGL
jgi:hypothetical protein